jgi:hypothetical protein
MLIIIGIVHSSTCRYIGVSAMRSDGEPFAYSAEGDPVIDWERCLRIAREWRAVVGIAMSADQFVHQSRGMYWIDDAAQLRTAAIRVGAA